MEATTALYRPACGSDRHLVYKRLALKLSDQDRHRIMQRACKAGLGVPTYVSGAALKARVVPPRNSAAQWRLSRWPRSQLQLGYRNVRYRGILKSGAQVCSLLALANLYLARRRLVEA